MVYSGSFKIYILVTYRQRVKFLIKNLQRPITLPVTYMKIDSKGHSFYCVLEIWLTDSWIVYEYGWTRTVLPQHWCDVLKINKILTYLLCKNLCKESLCKESCWICDGVIFFHFICVLVEKRNTWVGTKIIFITNHGIIFSSYIFIII